MCVWGGGGGHLSVSVCMYVGGGGGVCVSVCMCVKHVLRKYSALSLSVQYRHVCILCTYVLCVLLAVTSFLTLGSMQLLLWMVLVTEGGKGSVCVSCPEREFWKQ